MPRTTSRSKSKTATTKKTAKADTKKSTSRSSSKSSKAASKTTGRTSRSTTPTKKVVNKTTKTTKAPAKTTKAAAKTSKSPARTGRSTSKSTKATTKTTKSTGKGSKSPAAKDTKTTKAAKGKGKGKAASKKDDEEEEEEDKKPARPGRGAKTGKTTKAAQSKSKAATKAAAKNTKKSKKAADDEEEEEEEEKDTKKDTKKGGKRGRGKSQDDDAADAADTKSSKKKKLDLDSIEVKVDEHCGAGSSLKVYIKGNTIYDAKLNQSNVNANNNKFYVIQLLQSKTSPTVFYVYNRWGRVGVPGQDKLMGPMGEAAAIKEYEKKLHEKSVKGDYRVIELDYAKDTTAEAGKAMEKGLKSSSLKKPVADLISLIFDTQMANKQMQDIGYDTKKMPLGKLSKNSIEKGYAVLKKLLDAIESGKKKDLDTLSSEFYSLIPHDFGFKNMSNFIIKDEETVKKKLELLDSLSNVKATFELLQQKGGGDNILDANYKKLKCNIDPIDKGSKEFKLIQQFIDNTCEGEKTQIINMYSLDRDGEDGRYTKKLDNKMMLWHGSRLANFVGILSQGLRIAPPEAPASGYRFGKGIYLADMFSKSHGYCNSWGSDGTFCILLCESALGTPNELLHDNFNASKLPSGKHSTKALGHMAPHEKHHKEIEKGILIPQGKPEKTKHQNSSCYHNEFIIYDIKQVKLRYLIWMKDK